MLWKLKSMTIDKIILENRDTEILIKKYEIQRAWKHTSTITDSVLISQQIVLVTQKYKSLSRVDNEFELN